MDDEDVMEEPGEEVEVLPMNPGQAPRDRKASSPDRIAAKEKRARALSLRLNGANYEQIAKACGYSSAKTASAAVRNEIKKITRDSAEDLLTLNIERLNTYLLILQPQTLQGDKGAIQISMSIIDRLMALGAPALGAGGSPGGPGAVGGGDNFLVVIEGDSAQYIERLQVMAAHKSPDTLQADAIDANVIDAEAIEDEDDLE